MILPKHHITGEQLVTDTIHESQFQPCGVDLTLKAAYKFTSAGKIDFDNKERKLSEVEEVKFENNEMHLPQGSYKVVYGEFVRIPKDAAAFVYPRSSLLRCGATVESAVWDPGYEGRGEAMLVVHNPHGIKFKKNAKIAQMVFVRLSEAAKHLYDGQYKGENK